jgi:hypothetical protein
LVRRIAKKAEERIRISVTWKIFAELSKTVQGIDSASASGSGLVGYSAFRETANDDSSL